MVEHWKPGTIVTRYETLGLEPTGTANTTASWHRKTWLSFPVTVIEDTPELLAVFVEPGAPFTFPDGDWPTPDGLHPWHGREGWVGHGTLMIQRPGEHHAIWHFWDGDERTFKLWYINLQASFERVTDGFHSQDFELDLVAFPDGSWEYKDLEVLDERIAEGRFSPELIDWVRKLGAELGAKLDNGAQWWDPKWAGWTPRRASNTNHN